MDEISWPADVGPSKVWTTYTRGNIGEVYPEVVLPLESSLAWEAAEQGWRAGATTIGFAGPEDFGLGVRTPGMGPDLIDAQFLGNSDVSDYSPRQGDRRLWATVRLVTTALKPSRPRTCHCSTRCGAGSAWSVAPSPALMPLNRRLRILAIRRRHLNQSRHRLRQDLGPDRRYQPGRHRARGLNGLGTTRQDRQLCSGARVG